MSLGGSATDVSANEGYSEFGADVSNALHAGEACSFHMFQVPNSRAILLVEFGGMRISYAICNVFAYRKYAWGESEKRLYFTYSGILGTI